MENYARIELHDKLVSRKAEEAAWRRFQATAWLKSLVGPLGVSNHPSEEEFVSRLRNGLILCNAINKVHPGAVPKVVENYAPLQSLSRESQPLTAYQYFENVKNFLMAVEELNLPAFEASDLERDTLEAGSAAKVVDCILALKSYHECKQTTGGNGFYKHAKSPPLMHSASLNNSLSVSSDTCGWLDMSAASEKRAPADVGMQKLADLIVKLLAEHMADTKENVNDNLLLSFRTGKLDLHKLLSRVMSSCLEDKHQNNFLDKKLKYLVNDFLMSRSSSPDHSAAAPLQVSSEIADSKSCRACLREGKCKHRNLFQMQRKELGELKALLTNTRMEFEEFQSQFRKDLKELGYQVQDMSTAALGYHKVLQENRNLYNMVQDLTGNIRVYCRIRSATSGKSNIIDFIGEDGSLVILDPLKPRKDGRKLFQFNQVFGPTATQDQVYKDTQPLIRSVMDGYNVCIFAYGQTGSGKTYTMSGPSGGSAKDMGINYLALSDLFKMSRTRQDIIDYDIQVQMVEIYNEKVRDLLAEDSSTTKLEIRSCSGDNGLCVPDAKMQPVKSTDDVLNLMKIGDMNRVVSSTAMNNRSSRSHSVLTVHVHGKDTSGSTLRSCLHLVDLAGSERVDKSEVTGNRLKEAQYINKSLSCLGDVIAALAQRNSHVPYRNSKLTLILQDSLGGHAKTLMFAHVSPEADSFGETISTLKFAQRVSTVELGAARANKESSEIMRLKEQVENLKKALATKESQSMQTPPRLRRLSIENSSNIKSQTAKPLAGKETLDTQLNKIKESRSPFEKPKAITEQTPSRLRRLSIENGSSNMKSRTANSVERKRLKTPSITTHSRRLSLEGPRYSKKDNLQSEVAVNDTNQHLCFESAAGQEYDQSQDAEASSKLCGHSAISSSTMEKLYGHSAISSSIMEMYRLNAPKSPSFWHRKRIIQTNSNAQIPLLELPVTPEPQVLARTKGHNTMRNDPLPTDSQPANCISRANGNGSQIRKSLRNIGRLINGSEKRNQQHSQEEVDSTIKSACNNVDVRSPLSANTRARRRQSLTGVQALGNLSRRSSLGGKSDSGDPRRNARTPPQVHVSTKELSSGYNSKTVKKTRTVL